MNNTKQIKEQILISEEANNQTNRQEQDSEDNQLESFVFLVLHIQKKGFTLVFLSNH